MCLILQTVGTRSSAQDLLLPYSGSGSGSGDSFVEPDNSGSGDFGSADDPEPTHEPPTEPGRDCRVALLCVMGAF